jgi:hypothetical protein
VLGIQLFSFQRSSIGPTVLLLSIVSWCTAQTIHHPQWSGFRTFSDMPRDGVHKLRILWYIWSQQKPNVHGSSSQTQRIVGQTMRFVLFYGAVQLADCT